MLKGRVEEVCSTVTGLTDLANLKSSYASGCLGCGENRTQALVVLCVHLLRTLAPEQFCCVEISPKWKARIICPHFFLLISRH